MTVSPNRQVFEAGRLLTDIAATLTTEALTHIANVINGNDGYPASTMGDGSHGADNTSTTERTALHTVDCGDADHRAHEVYLMRAKREDIRDLRFSIVMQIRDYIGLCQSVLPRDDRQARLCDGRGFEGSHIPWMPHSRDERNGWHDPTCVDAADESGLCPKCKLRERRWRRKSGLSPRAANAAQPGTEAA